jgi:hypothetical protein
MEVKRTSRPPGGIEYGSETDILTARWDRISKVIENHFKNPIFDKYCQYHLCQKKNWAIGSGDCDWNKNYRCGR